MIGYDTNGPQTPPKWDEPEFIAMHSELDLFEKCDGEIEEYTEKPEGWPERLLYRCTKCGKNVTNEVVNNDRDTVDWEFDQER